MGSGYLRKLRLLTIVLLVIMLVAGGTTFALASLSLQEEASMQGMGTINITASPDPIFAGAQHIGNIAPGDQETGSLTVKNKGNSRVRVYLKHVLDGAIFKQFPNSDHPLQISYAIQIYNRFQLPVGTKIEVPVFSSNQNSPSFELGRNEQAIISYTYAMPLEAGNDYQGQEGQLDVHVIAHEVSVPPPTCEEKGTCPPTCEESGTCPPTCEESGTCPPTCEESGTCPPACEESGTCPPACEESGTCPPACEESGTCPPACEESGTCPPACEESGTCPPTCEESGTCPPACEESGTCPPTEPPTEPKPNDPDPKPAPPTKPPLAGEIPGGTQPRTGVAVIETVWQGAGLLLFGGLLILLARRRGHH
ncbi:hypothetical protein CIG75_20170 [Tumebacillus algifaecis]|uniref:Uncharacterized protein n=1 Tax=Tumebacillus algifaecis TaxID=1214604 RepID=A0A223D6G2_9BACL|nr:hypothetical protein CIG75_20170 [Tumebacillus algifaecis]